MISWWTKKLRRWQQRLPLLKDWLASTSWWWETALCITCFFFFFCLPFLISTSYLNWWVLTLTLFKSFSHLTEWENGCVVLTWLLSWTTVCCKTKLDSSLFFWCLYNLYYSSCKTYGIWFFFYIFCELITNIQFIEMKILLMLIFGIFGYLK